jgi:hypothetical protein
VVVPVIVERRPHVHGQRDLVGPYELLGERDLRLAGQIGVAERLAMVEDVAALSLERLPKLASSSAARA